MKLPVFKTRNKYKRRIVAFGGINLTQNFSDGEMRELCGITHKDFPVLTQSPGSERIFDCERPETAFSGSEICVAANDGFYYGERKVGELSAGEKTIVEIGNKIVIFPDKVYYDIDKNKFLSMENIINLSGIKINYQDNKLSVPNSLYETVTTAEINVYEPDFKVVRCGEIVVEDGKVKPSGLQVISVSELKTDDFYFITNVNGQYHKVFSVTENKDGKITVSGEIVKVQDISGKIFSGFNKGDVVEIKGSKLLGDTFEGQIMDLTPNSLSFPEGSLTTGSETVDLTIKRKIPDMTFVCVHENRLWGCVGKTIYASKLGDPLNFYVYQGLSTDSYTVESNSAGAFTAATVYGNVCFFFKEDKCYKLYGNKPSNFSLTESFGVGIKKEDAKSIVNINGQLLYKGVGGIYSFTGGFPGKISEKLGEKLPENCVGGGKGDCYYLTGDLNGKREEYVFDTRNGLWSKSGVMNVNGYFSKGEDLYRLMEYGIEKISDEPDENIKWHAEFCPFDEDYHKTKNYSKLHITALLTENSWIKAEVSRDGEPWQKVAVKYGSKKEYVNIPCVVRNCHELRLRLSGKGKSIIESVVREFSVN